MKEEFLHYVWRFQKYRKQQLKTYRGSLLKVLKVGTPNPNAGPDFLMAHICVDDKQWVGHVEIHINSSDWMVHGHDTDSNYDNVILHVVWENDIEICLPNGHFLEVLELKDLVSENLLHHYARLVEGLPQFIACERECAKVPSLVIEKWLERLYVERLENKVTQVNDLLDLTKNHWEAVCFYLIAQAFGMKVNGSAFLSMAQSIDFKIIRKCTSHPVVMEALFLGQAGLLEEECTDAYFKFLQSTYRYLQLKFGIENAHVERPQFFRLRPNNFPTIRLSQLAVLWSSKPTIFGALIKIDSVKEAYRLFEVDAAYYWKDHYRFGVVSKSRPKAISKLLVHSILLNVVIPLQLVYAAKYGKEIWSQVETLSKQIPIEKNKVIRNYEKLFLFENHAWNGQALLQMHKRYCSEKRCANCGVGAFLLKELSHSNTF